MSVVSGRDAKKFSVVRNSDESGISGVGRVLDGIIWHNNLVSICWRTSIEGCDKGWTSINLYPNYITFYNLHIRSHPSNNTVVDFEAELEPTPKEAMAIHRCNVCGLQFIEHPRDKQWLDDNDEPFLRRICNGELIKII